MSKASLPSPASTPPPTPQTKKERAYTYRKQAGAEFLDRCNGRVGPDGTYRYHATSTFPYILGCFRGTPAGGAGPGTGPGVPNPCPGP